MSQQLHDEIKEAIQSLGTTPKEVYKTLLHDNIKGERFALDRCPLTVYLNKHVTTPNNKTILVGAGAAMIILDHYNEIVLLSPAAEQFRSKFDRGRYRKLRA